MPLVGIIDLDVEIQKLEKDLMATQATSFQILKKLSNRGFLEKAQEEIVEKEREKLAESGKKRKGLRNALNELKE